MQELILASQSPRRSQLLKEAGYEFRIYPVKVSEIIDENLNLDEALKDLSRRKALAVLSDSNILNKKGILVLAADTIVVLDKKIYGKPQNLDQARIFLSELSGQEHCVKTALCLMPTDSRNTFCAVDTTFVRFKNLSKAQIEEYLAVGESMDKAGAYAIQGEGKRLVAQTSGSWSNVVGLPMELFESMLKENGWSLRRKQNN